MVTLVELMGRFVKVAQELLPVEPLKPAAKLPLPNPAYGGLGTPATPNDTPD